MTAPPPQPPADDLAPTPLEELLPEVEEEESKGEGGDEGKGGDGKKSGGTGGKKPKANPDLEARGLADNENLEDYDSERLIEKLKMLVWAPFSVMVPGASSFESEHDLKRKLFLGQLGLMTNQIEASDIADPLLIEKLERRNQERQQQTRIEIAAAGSAAAMGGAVAALQEKPQSQQKKQDNKNKTPVQKQKDTPDDDDQDYDGDEPAEQSYTSEPKRTQPKPDTADASATVTRAPEDYSAEPEKEDGLSLMEAVEIRELGPKDEAQEDTFDDVGQSTTLDTTPFITETFNLSAQPSELAEPAQKTEYRFVDPAPKVDAGATPTGI